MKVLMLHADDSLDTGAVRQNCDLVADLGRAGLNTYFELGKSAGLRIISLQDFADEERDLRLVRSLLHPGANSLLDSFGIDWWNVLAPTIALDLRQLILVGRLASYIGGECDIFCTRIDYRCVALHKLLGGRLMIRDGTFRRGRRRLRHYSEFLSKFGFRGTVQIVQDKFDSKHAIRRRFGKKWRAKSGLPLILLPSAYSNASQTALAYTALLPQEQFLLVCARNNARVQNLPRNVEAISLDPYFSASGSNDNAALLKSWERLRSHLTARAPEYEFGSAPSLFDRMPMLLRWGTAIRDAWARVFESERIESCFCTDHTNPYTKIPLLLAKHAGVPAIACHHGALDWGMATTAHDADFYVAKSAMEYDYMERVCGISSAKILTVPAPVPTESSVPVSHTEAKPWLVFFSEPYEIWSWRRDEVFKELLPQLCSLADETGLKLVFKLHPFESARSHRKLLLRHLHSERVGEIEILTGPMTDELWQKTRIALTVQSSIAVECATRGVPIFLCAWLRDCFSGYVEQYQKFGAGYRLDNASQISSIPSLLTMPPPAPFRGQMQSALFCAEVLKELLCGSHSPSTAAQG